MGSRKTQPYSASGWVFRADNTQNMIMTQAFFHQLANLRKEAKDVEFVFIDAPHVLQPIDFKHSRARNPAIKFDVQESEAQTVGLGGAEPLLDPLLAPRTWWRPNRERTRAIGLGESLLVIKDVLKTRTFDGILGFSQGAAFAIIISALLEKPEAYPPFLIDGKPPHPPMKFCIAVSGFKLADPICNTLLEPSYSTPTLHIFGKNDLVIVKERTKKLIAVSSKNRVIEHEGGHFFPTGENWSKFLAEFLKNPFGDVPSPVTAFMDGTRASWGTSAKLFAQKL